MLWECAFLIFNLINVKCMDPNMRDMLTPLKELQEFCGYESCSQVYSDMINVHIVPHTHAELGYTKTFDQHYDGHDEIYVKSNINMERILDYVITELWAHEDRTFTVSDMPYFFHWWSRREETDGLDSLNLRETASLCVFYRLYNDECSEELFDLVPIFYFCHCTAQHRLDAHPHFLKLPHSIHRMVYTLVRQGRLHFVGGGWGMPDEACTNYQAIIDQFTYNLRKMNSTFLDCGRPLVAWQADVLGHSREFTSLIAQMGFDGLFINPISFEDEMERMSRRALEFVWRGSDDLGAETDIYTHKLFDGYWTPPGFCFGGLCKDPLLITSDTLLANINERVELFIESARHRQAPFYTTNNIMVVMGMRFAYYDAGVWFANIDKLINHVNQKSFRDGSNVRLLYSSPACYLKAVHDKRPTLETKQDDFLPYGFDKLSYATGSHTSRPSLKVLAKEGNIYLQIIKQLQVVAKLGEYRDIFQHLNWINGVIQDHNIITGSLRGFVKDYYVHKMYVAIQKSTVLIKNALHELQGSPHTTVYYRCSFNISSCRNTNGPRSFIVVYNPLAWRVSLPIRLPIRKFEYVVLNPKGEEVPSSIMPIPKSVVNIPLRNTTADHELIFIAENLPPVGYRSYYIEIRNILTSRFKRAVKNDLNLENYRQNRTGDKQSNNSSKKSNSIMNIDKDNNKIILNLDNININESKNKQYRSKIEKRQDDSEENNTEDFVSVLGLNYTRKNGKFKKSHPKVIIGNKSMALNIDNYKTFIPVDLFDKKGEDSSELERFTPRVITKSEGDITNRIFNNTFIKTNETDTEYEIEYEDIDNPTESLISKSTTKTITKISTETNTRVIPLESSVPKQSFENRRLFYNDLSGNIENTSTSTNGILEEIKLQTLSDSFDSIEFTSTQTNKQIEKIYDINNTEASSTTEAENNTETENTMEAESTAESYSTTETYSSMKADSTAEAYKPTESDIATEAYSTTETYSTTEAYSTTDAYSATETYSSAKTYSTANIAEEKYSDISFPEILPSKTNSVEIDENVTSENETDSISIISVLPRPIINTELKYPKSFNTLDKESLNVETVTSRYVKQKQNVDTIENVVQTTEFEFLEESPAERQKKYYYEDSDDLFIDNKYVRVTIDPATRKISRIDLTDDMTLEFDIQFYYYESDDPRKTGRSDRQPGAYIFRPLDSKPVPIIDFVKTKVLKNDIIQEIHCMYSDYASFNLKLYKISRILEIDWVIGPIPIENGLGKEVFVRYMTDLISNSTFYTDSNGRQTMKRIRDARPTFVPISLDKIAGNFYPVTSKISIEDTNKNIRLSIFPDRTQGATSLYDGEVDIMLNRRILTDDRGIQATLDEIEEKKGVVTRGKHYIYISKLDSEYGRVIEKKFAKEIQLQPQIFVSRRNVYGNDTRNIWSNQNNEFSSMKTSLPLGVHLLTLEKWDEDLLIRLENYLEIKDFPAVAAKIVKLKNIFRNIEVLEAREMTLGANKQLKDWVPLYWHTTERFYKNFNEFYGGNNEELSDKEQLNPIAEVDLDEGVTLTPQQIRTFIVKYRYKGIHNKNVKSFAKSNL